TPVALARLRRSWNCSVGWLASTTSLRLYGWPSGPRVESALARFETATSMRWRSAVRALALASIADPSVDISALLTAFADGVAHQPELGGECGLGARKFSGRGGHVQQLAVDLYSVAIAARRQPFGLLGGRETHVGVAADVARIRGAQA